MTSILTNIAANTALLTLQNTVKSLQDTENRISTGKRINSAADNAAYFSISTSLSSDSSALSAVTDSLNFGASTLDTQTAALSQASSVVSQIKAKLVTAATPGIDRTKIQGDISSLQQQLNSIANSASFNGQNFLAQDSTATAYNSVKNFVASFSRDSSGVNVGTISVDTSNIKLFDNKAALTSLESQTSTVTQQTNVSATALSATVFLAAATGTAGATATVPNLAVTSTGTSIDIKYTDQNLAGAKVGSDLKIANSVLSSSFNSATDVTLAATASQTLASAQATTGITAASGSATGNTYSSYDAATKTLTLSTFTADNAVAGNVFVNTVTVKNVLASAVAGVASTSQTAATGTALAPASGTTPAVNVAGSVATAGPAAAPTVDATGNLTLTAADNNATPNYVTQTVSGAVLGGNFNAAKDVTTTSTALGGGIAAGAANPLFAGAQANQTYSSYNSTAKQLTVTTFTQDGTSNKLLATTSVINNVVGYGSGLLDKQDSATTGSSGSVSGQQANDSLFSLDVSKLGDDDKSLAKLNAYTRLADNAVANLATAASTIGSARSRITLQQSFVTALKTSIDQGVGALVDADLNVESTKLQALQVQQQLGVQSLSIANQSTQSILKLFQ